MRSARGRVLYILDIVAANKTPGFTVANQIRRQTGSDRHAIVFLTAYAEQIVVNTEYKTIALNCILKHTPHMERELADTIASAQQAFDRTTLFARTGRFEQLAIPHREICFIEAIKGSGKLCIHCIEAQYVIRHTLSAISAELPDSFLRCHKSTILNPANVRKVDRPGRIVHFVGGESCPYSEKRKVLQRIPGWGP